MLTDLLERAVRRDAAKTALVCGAERIGYGTLATRVGRCAAGLRALGIGAGDCVAVVLPNCPEFVITLLAVARLRGILLPLSPLYRHDELARLMVDAGVRAIVTDRLRETACRPVAAGFDPPIPLISVVHPAGGGDFAQLGAGLAALVADGQPPWRGPALYLTTSGSTDTYKRVCCTQENLYYEALNFVDSMGLTAEDTILCAIPLHHSYGLGNCLLDALYCAATLVLLDPAGEAAEAPFASRIGDLLMLIRRERVRIYPGVPHQFSVLAALPPTSEADLSGLRFCISSGDVLPKRVFDAFLARFGQPIRSLYGSSEAGSISIDRRPADALRFGSLGRPLKNVDLVIRDPAGGDVPSGETGTIWVRSPTIPPTLYDNRPTLTAQMLRGGFYNTGDEGRIDADGHLVMTGRKQSFVDIAGYKVDLGEVEEALQSCPGVIEAAALGVDIPHMGRLIKASIVAVPGCTDVAIRAHCRERLAFFKLPRLIERRERLPRSPIGKVLKSELADVSAYLAGIAAGDLARQAEAAPPARRRAAFERLVESQVVAVLDRPPHEVGRKTGFADLGLDSFTAIELRARLEYLLGTELPETVTFDYPSVADLAEYLSRK